MLGLQLRCLCLSISLSAAPLLAAETVPAEGIFFETHIRPLLIQHCYKCHSEKAGKRKGGLWLDRKDGWATGGETGPSIIPGDVTGSLLLKSVRYESLKMPPQRQLPRALIARLEEWVRRGAYDPRTAASRNTQTAIDINAGRQFWSFQPISQPLLPIVVDRSWPRTDIDHFLLAKLERAQLAPAPDATRAILLRRVYLALTGLPPSIEQQDAFLSDLSDDAFERVVDRLLTSHAFAERWARHWLDIIRYADTTGGGGSQALPDAWRLRDYVIQAFRNDKPLNQLIREHVAGDLLPFSSHTELADQLAATGLLVLGPHNYGGQDKQLLALEIVDEQIDTIGKAFLGMTIGCARCHDHKFDPIPTSDYYALAGIFLSTQSVADTSAAKWFTRAYPLSPQQEAERAARQTQITTLEREVDDLKMQIKALNADASANKEVLAKRNATLKQKETLVKKLKEHKDPPQPTIMCVGEVEEPQDTSIRVRGQPRALGAKVPRRFLQVATTSEMAVSKIDRGSGRLELANWIASDRNPLPARVLANRIWQHLFGQGIVRTPDNFGTTGTRPTHSALLDHLAVQLMRNDWSTRKLIRTIVLSRAWQMASTVENPQATAVDPENKLLWRANKRRVDAEILRDSILLLSGSLDPRRGGPSLPDDFKSEFTFKHTSQKRSIYIPVFRNQLHEIFSTFDFANPSFVVGKRFESTIPTQSLYLMNSPFIYQHAKAAAVDLLGQLTDPEDAIHRVYRHILCRRPRPEELALTREFLKAENFSSEVRIGLIRSLFACVDFQYIH
ncbi:MAG: PSD1 and planctomycete cytochrome C domain-containing protein [Planctomycetota bacterium]|nr:PSD1 and planctomycete cytochrome C domain-containing protein [Planctomycetota bacterium]